MLEPRIFIYYVLGFFGFSLCLATRDFTYRYLLLGGLTLWDVLFYSGLVASGVGLSNSLLMQTPFKINNARLQGLRFVVSCFTYLTIIKSFSLLNATSIAICSKAYIPILILMGPILGNHYRTSQLLLSIATLVFLIAFAVLSRDPSEPMTGYYYLLLAVGFVIAEFVMLRTSTIKENTFIVAITPSLACLLIGLMGKLFQGTDFSLPISLCPWAFLAGTMLYSGYILSIYRYRVLPLGVAEYPALITALFILPAEYFFFQFRPSPLYLSNLTLSLITLGLCVAIEVKRKKPRQASQPITPENKATIDVS